MATSCPRVQNFIECPDCGYPATEALYMLTPNECGPQRLAYDPIGDEVIDDPGHNDFNVTKRKYNEQGKSESL